MTPKKRFAVFMILITSFSGNAFAGERKLTTYYPAPYGEYKKMKVGSSNASNPEDGVVNFKAVGQPATPNKGDLYFDSGATPQFKYNADGTAGGWKPMGGMSGCNQWKQAYWPPIGTTKINDDLTPQPIGACKCTTPASGWGPPGTTKVWYGTVTRNHADWACNFFTTDDQKTLWCSGDGNYRIPTPTGSTKDGNNGSGFYYLYCQ